MLAVHVPRGDRVYEAVLSQSNEAEQISAVVSAAEDQVASALLPVPDALRVIAGLLHLLRVDAVLVD